MRSGLISTMSIAMSALALACGGNAPHPESAGGASGAGAGAFGQGGATASGAGSSAAGSSAAGTTAGGGAGGGAAAGASGQSAGAGGMSVGAGGGGPAAVLVITPGATSVIQGQTTQFAAAVRGGTTGTVTWTVVEKTNCGSINASGLYTAPATLPQSAACHVQATSAVPPLTATVTATIVRAPATGKLDTWENVTPAGVSLDPDFHGADQNFGVTGMVADPVRPNELYAFICYQGVWKSTDYGLTWKKINTGTNSAKLDSGRPWTAVIDDNPARDAATPPTLYTAAGYGTDLGIYKSTDGGVNWTIYGAGMDIYSFNMDPYDHQHLITGFHESSNVAESTDGGLTWKTIKTDKAQGSSIYPYFMDTGDPTTTRKTWFLIPQVDSGTSSYTTDAGGSFKANGGFGHPHGGNQAFNDSPKLAYVAGIGGVYQTTDAGVSWKKMYAANDPHPYAAGVVATKNTLYSWDSGSNLSGIGGAWVHKAARVPGTQWTSVVTPAEMNNGPTSVAVTYDGAHYILVGGAVAAGIWRYVEP